MDINELQSFKLSDAVKFHDELNPKLWTIDGKLLPEVQEQLENIAEDFLMSLGISDLKVKDITISGSNAAYSYTPHSDLDLHILIDFNELPDDEVYKELFNAKKTVYNDTHDIKINDIPVELYVQDTNQKHTSLGEYSVKNKDWVKFPIKRRANLDQKETRLKYEKLGNLIELAIKLKDPKRIDKVLDTLKRYRRAGLDKTGEFGPENLAYKLIRTHGLLQALIDTKNEIHSKNLSLPEDSVLEVIDLPKKNYEIVKNRYYTDEVKFTTKTGNEYIVGFIPNSPINSPKIARYFPKFIDKHTSGKEVYFDMNDDGGFNIDKNARGSGTVPLTGTGDEFKVFGTVSDIIHNYIRTKKPVYLIFTADEKRESLYRKIAKKILRDFDTFKLIKIPYKKNADVYLVYNTEYTSNNVDEAIDLKNLVSDPKKLKTYDTHISPKEAYRRLRRGETDEYLVRIVAKDPQFAFYYAYNVLKGPFPLGEPALAKDNNWAFDYNYYIMQGRPWTGLKKKKKTTEAIDLKKLVTNPKKLKTHDTHIGPEEALNRLKNGATDEYLVRAVAKESISAYDYALFVLKGPFPLGEPTIAKDPQTAYYYAIAVLNGPFPLAEPTFAKNGYWAFSYAKNVLKSPFPLGEPEIAKYAGFAYTYAKDILKGPFPLGEPEIARSHWKDTYETDVLKGRPWTGLDQKVDEAIDLKNLVSDPKKLKTYKTHISAEEAYVKLRNGAKDEYLVRIVAKDPKSAYYYATAVLNGPFPLGEPAIAKDAEFSYYYAKNILKGPFPLGEPTIAKDRGWAFNYANEIKGPFPLGEPTIAKNAITACNYAEFILKGRFPLGEPVLAQNPEFAYEYAHILKAPFPLGEPAIAKHPYVSLGYAKNILKGPFPLAEPVIREYPAVAMAYENDVLKGRPWTGLKKKTTEAIDLKKLVSDPKKLKTYKTHISPKEAFNRLKKGEKNSTLIHAVAKSPNWATYYAVDILKGPFPLGEPAIATDANCSYDYATLLGGPWPPGEPAIAKDPLTSRIYAGYILNKPFPLGEPAIATSAYNSFVYAMSVLKKRFPLGEPQIATRAGWAYQYAWSIIKGPFPMAEPAIYRSDLREKYEKNILKGRPWTNTVAIDNDQHDIDEAIDLKNLVTDPKKLKTHDTHIGPEEAYEKLKNGETDEYLVRAVAKDPKLSYAYARDILKGPFPLSEPAIAKDGFWSYSYAMDVLKGPFPLGEPKIAKDSNYAYRYALMVLEKPFPLGEPAIAKDPVIAYYYAKDVLKGPFPLGEPAIYQDFSASNRYKQFLEQLKHGKKKTTEAIDLKKLVTDPTKLKTYDTHISAEEAFNRLVNGATDEYLVHAVAKDPNYAFDYAKDVLKGPFPLGEPAIAKNATWSYFYAKDVLKGPFPLGEPILYNSSWRIHYVDYVLKGRPWTDTKDPWTKVTEAIDLKKLVTDPTKLKTYDTHISPQEALRRIEKGETDEYLVRIVAKDPWTAYLYARDILKGRFPLGESTIAKSSRPNFAYYYARRIIKGSWPKGEPTIAKSAEYAYRYASSVLKGPFPLGEPKIAKDSESAYWYAKDVLKGPFPLGEPAIAKEGYYAFHYAKFVLKNPFKLGEPAIYNDPNYRTKYEKEILKGRPWTGLDQKVDEAIDLKNLVSDPTKLKTYDTHISPQEALRRIEKGETDEYLVRIVAKDPIYAYLYAREILKDPFPLGESAIAKAGNWSYHYARDVLKGPFPLGESAIAKNSHYAYLYAMTVLTEPFPSGEPAIAEHAYYAFVYAVNVLKGPFPLGEPAIAKDARWKDLYEKEILKGRSWTGLDQKVDETNIQESASGYIPSKKEKNDPRYSMALTVDIKPDTMQQNAKKLGWKISRTGIPPLLIKPKT